MRRATVILAVFLLVVAKVWAFEANMFIFAVTDAGEGIPAKLIVDVKPGSGNIGIDLGQSIVGESTQESVRDAIRAAARAADVNWQKYDFFVKIVSDAEKIEGPSAGLPIALLTYGALKGKDIPDYISGTGQIDADGTVYPVGGVFAKAKAAHEVGVKIFLIPAGERNTIAEIEEEVEPGIVEKVEKEVDLVKYAKEHWGMEVYEVKDLEEAIKIVFEGKRPEQNIPKITPVEEELTNFIPPEANVMHSGEFRDIAEKLVEKARNKIREAKECDLHLKDHTIEKYLKDSLTTAESMADRAATLLERGYYYTAANYAFLATIDAETYALICEHPSLLNPSSVAFQDLLQDTENQIDALESILNDANINRNNFEWIGGARDRLIRAESYFESIKGTIHAEPSPTYVRQLVSVREWIESAREMYNKGKSIEGAPISDLDKLAKEAIISVEDTQEMVDVTDPSVQERIQWARSAYERGWYYTAAVEAMSARGLALGNIIADREDPVDALADLMADKFTPVGLWDELYLHHAEYYYYAAKEYKRNGKEEKAKDMATTGLQLYKMAEGINWVNKTILSAPTVVIQTRQSTGEWDVKKYTLPAAAAVLVISVLLLFLLLASKSQRRTHETIVKEHKYRRKIIELEHRIHELEKKAEKDPEAKKELAKLKRQLGRTRKLLEKIKQGA